MTSPDGVRPQRGNLRHDRGVRNRPIKSGHPYLYLDIIVFKRTWRARFAAYRVWLIGRHVRTHRNRKKLPGAQFGLCADSHSTTVAFFDAFGCELIGSGSWQNAAGLG
jgi:hypothetical protein